MTSIRRWALWRRIQYTSAFILLLVALGVLIYYVSFYQAPTCFDQTLNGLETGVDCGGECVQICVGDAVMPDVVWVESFEIFPGQYNAVAYLENGNSVAGTPDLNYTFELYSGSELVAERTGVTPLPPNSTYPIFEGRIFTDATKPVTETRIVIETPPYWLPADQGSEQFITRRIEPVEFGTNPQLEVDIENDSVKEARDVEVVATIFNDQGEPLTASETFIEQIGGRSTDEIIFTWPSPIAKTVRSCIIPTDVAMVIDVSGSMNNDGDEPPEHW